MNKDFIFNPNPQKPVAIERKEEYYCVIGDHEYLDAHNNPRLYKDTPKSLAKIVESALSTKFFIKMGRNGRIYNPIGLYSEGKESKFLAKIGKNEWEYKEVNKGIFDQYITFLRTKNIAWLNNAERELL